MLPCRHAMRKLLCGHFSFRSAMNTYSVVSDYAAVSLEPRRRRKDDALQCFAHLFYTIFYSTTLPEYSNNPINDMYIFPQEPARSATNVTCFLNALKYNFLFLLRGLGTIHVERVEYRKSRSAEEHEYLVVTVKESAGAWWRGYLLVDRLDDNPLYRTATDPKDGTLPAASTDSSSCATLTKLGMCRADGPMMSL